jgi:hypothetical protein
MDGGGVVGHGHEGPGHAEGPFSHRLENQLSGGRNGQKGQGQQGSDYG